MGRIRFSREEERELLLTDQSNVDLMYGLYDRALLYLFIQAGRFPPGRVKPAKVCEALS